MIASYADIPDPDRKTQPYTWIVRPHSAGFFSNFNKVIDCLDGGLRQDGAEAVVVDWSLSKPVKQFPYGCKDDGNVWEKLFKPLPFPSVPATRRESPVFFNRKMKGIYAYTFYKTAKWRQNLNRIYRQYIHSLPHIQDAVNHIMHPHENSYRVGVHYRHPGHDRECPFSIPEVEAFITSVRDLVRSRQDWVVVLATDVQSVCDAFKKEFGNRLVLQPNVYRSAGAQQVHEDPTIKPGLRLAEEVLIDSMMLARCNAFVHVTSNIATAVGYMNPELKMVYCEPLWQKVLFPLGIGAKRIARRKRKLYRLIARRKERLYRLIGRTPVWNFFYRFFKRIIIHGGGGQNSGGRGVRPKMQIL